MTQDESVLEAIRTHIKQYGKPPPDMKKLMAMTKLPMKTISRSVGRLADRGAIIYSSRDYSSIQMGVELKKNIEKEMLKSVPTAPKRKYKRTSPAAKTNGHAKENPGPFEMVQPPDVKRVVDVLVAIDALEAKRDELIGQRKRVDDEILLIGKAVALLSGQTGQK